MRFRSAAFRCTDNFKISDFNGKFLHCIIWVMASLSMLWETLDAHNAETSHKISKYYLFYENNAIYEEFNNNTTTNYFIQKGNGKKYFRNNN